MEPRRPSYEILEDLIERVGAKAFAYSIRVNQSLVYKWKEKPENAEDLFGAAANGRSNPLDRTQDILRIAVTEGHHELAVEIIDWLARELGGAFVSGEDIAAISKVASTLVSPAPVKARRVR